VYWRVLVAHFTSPEALGDAQHFKKNLTNYDKFKMCFLADLLFLLTTFEKRLQSYSLTLLDFGLEYQN